MKTGVDSTRGDCLSALASSFFELPVNEKMEESRVVTLKRIMHTCISLSSVFCLVYGTVSSLFGMTNEKYHEVEVLMHGYEYSPYFLTLWVMSAHIIYYYMYSAIDIIEMYYSKNQKLLQLTEYIHKVASYLLFTIIFPMSVFIVIAFWTAYMWDRERMYPQVIDEFLPSWLNHCMHTFPLPLSLIYMFTSNRHEPSKLFAAAGLGTFLSVYWGIFIGIKILKGKWVYYFLEAFAPKTVHFLICLAWIGPVLFFLLGYKVNKVIQGIKSNLSVVLKL